MNIIQKYQQIILEAKARHKDELDSIQKLLEAEQETCKHDYEILEDLFYACGETAPGKHCKSCGINRHLTDKERLSWSNKKWNI